MPQADNSRGGVTRARKVKKKKPYTPPATSRSDSAQRTGARTPKPKVVRPTKQQVTQARQQERAYESQGRAVEKDAQRKTRVRKRREARVRGRSDAAQGGGYRQMERAQEYVRKGYERKFGDKADKALRLLDRDGKPAVQADRALDVAQRRAKDQLGSLDAPALKVLDQTTRPIHGVAAGTRAAIKGENVGKAALKGVKLEDRSLFSDVLKDAGVPGAIASPVGTVLDIGLDPTTYVTGGTGSVARKAAQSASKSATKKALKSGLSKEQAARMGAAAARQAVKKSPDAKGVTVRVAGKEVPGVRKGTAKAAQPVRRVTRKVTPSRARTGTRNVLADVNPDVVPTGVAEATHREAVRATRTARAGASQGRDRAQKRALGVKRQLSKDDYARVIDALESGSLRGLPDDLRKAAVAVRSDLRYANRLRKRAGIKGGERKNYVPHQLTDDALKAEGKKPKGSGTRTINPNYGKARKDQRSLKQIREGTTAPIRVENVREVVEEFDTATQKAIARYNRRAAHTVKSKAVRAASDYSPDPKRINERRWFHGTNASGMSARTLDGSGTDIANLFGQGVYLTSDKQIAAGYARARAKRGGRERIYGAQVKVRKPLDLEAPAQQDFADVLANRAKWIGDDELAARLPGLVGKEGWTNERLYDEFREAIGDYAYAEGLSKDSLVESFQILAGDIKERGYDALTHVGGKRTGQAPHQVVILLDPQDTSALGVANPAKQFGYAKGEKTARAIRGAIDPKPRTKVVRSVTVKPGARVEPQPGRYSEDLPSLAANRVAKGAEDAARAGLNRRLGDLGRQVKRGRPVELRDGEAVFHIKGSDIRKVTDNAELDRIVNPLKPVVKNGQVVRVKGGNTAGGRYVVLSEEVVKRATEGVAPKMDWTDKGIVRGYDKMQAGFKRVALATPGYHVRNLVGDSFNAFLGQPGQRLPGNMARSAKVLKAAGRRDKANLGLVPISPKRGTMKTGRYGKLTYDQIAEGLAQAGAFRTGFTAKEIPELAQSGKGSVVKVNRVSKGRVGQGVKRLFLNREDLPRVATAVEALRRGATWEEAAEYVSQHHFDYQHLTQFERNVARRLAPFYTFTARNIPLQTRKLVTNPGKYAQYEKIRQEAAKATGIEEDAKEARALYDKLEQAGVVLPEGWEKYLADWEKRNAGVPVNWKGSNFTVSFALPLMDLSQVPGAAGKRQLQEYFEKAMSMATPLLKNPTEYFSNYSFFFKDQIQREWSPNVAAPAYVSAFPEDLKGKLGVTRIQDKRTGEMVWAWPAKVDYIAKSVPGTPAFVQNMMTGGADRRGRHDLERVLGFMGVKAVPVDPITNAVNQAYARMDEIAAEKGNLNQQGVSAKNPTPEYRKLLDQEKILREITFRGKQLRGDAVLPPSGGPKKRPPASSVDVLRKAKPSSGGGFSISDYSNSGSSSSGSGSGFQISTYP